MTTTLAVVNQKGGVAKTTTVVSLGSALAELGHRVLLVDLDPQACLSFSVGLDPEALELSIHDVLPRSGGRRRWPCGPPRTASTSCPATIDLAGAEAHLLMRTGREYVLAEALEDVASGYDFVLLDCSPSLGVLTLNALTAADVVLIPLQCETLSHRGVGHLLDTVREVQKRTNRDLEVLGVLPTLFDSRTNHSRAVLADVSVRYGLDVLEPPIPKSVRFAEAPAIGRSVLATARTSKGAEAYREHARQLAERFTPVEVGA